MVTPYRSRSPAAIVRLVITAVERCSGADGSARIEALHGVNGQKRWRLTLPDALLAARTGRYVFEVEHEGQRRRAEVLGEPGHERLYAPGAGGGDRNLLDTLPDAHATAG